MNNSLSIPYLVEGPVFTALSMEATDEGGLPIVGAKLPGRAATDEASAWFGNVFEMGKTIDDAGKEHFTLFLRPFTDAQNRRHLLKTSASPTGLARSAWSIRSASRGRKRISGWCSTCSTPTCAARSAEEVAGAPGLAGTPTEYGEAFAVAAAPPAASGELPPLTLPRGLAGARAGAVQTRTPAPINNNAGHGAQAAARRDRARRAAEIVPELPWRSAPWRAGRHHHRGNRPRGCRTHSDDDDDDYRP